MYLTKRQRQVLNFIETFIRENEYSPSLEEIGKGMKLSSLATVHKHLVNLEKKGVMRRLANRSRSIELEPVSPLSGVQPYIPLVGEVAAGVAIETYEDTRHEKIEVPRELITGRDNFVLRVRGNSMIEESIADGDFIICEKREHAESGETVVALIDGHEATVKKFYPSEGRVRLQPANPDMQPQFFDPERITIQGVVVGLLRRY